MTIEQSDAGSGSEIAGIVKDMSGAVIPRATVRVIESATGRVHSVRAGRRRTIRVAGLPAGRFRCEYLPPGLRGSEGFVLKEGDRAVLTAILRVGSVDETVEVRRQRRYWRRPGRFRQNGGELT